MAPAMLAPSRLHAGGQSVGQKRTAQAKPGLLLMFPSWLSLPGVPSRRSVRISIAINMTPAASGAGLIRNENCNHRSRCLGHRWRCRARAVAVMY